MIIPAAHTHMCMHSRNHQAGSLLHHYPMYAHGARRTKARAPHTGRHDSQAAGRHTAVSYPALPCLKPSCRALRTARHALHGASVRSQPAAAASAAAAPYAWALQQCHAHCGMPTVASTAMPAVWLCCATAPQQCCMERLHTATTSSWHRARGTAMLPGWWSEQRTSQCVHLASAAYGTFPHRRSPSMLLLGSETQSVRDQSQPASPPARLAPACPPHSNSSSTLL